MGAGCGKVLDWAQLEQFHSGWSCLVLLPGHMLSGSMRTQRFHFVATMIFAIGFILAGSGWSFVLSSMDRDRPEWSVCGQDMCSCVMPMAGGPDCPLCEAGLMDPLDSEEPVRRVPKNNKSVEALGGAGSNIVVAFFVGMMMGRADASVFIDADRVVILTTNDRAPISRGLELATPPPRG